MRLTVRRLPCKFSVSLVDDEDDQCSVMGENGRAWMIFRHKEILSYTLRYFRIEDRRGKPSLWSPDSVHAKAIGKRNIKISKTQPSFVKLWFGVCSNIQSKNRNKLPRCLCHMWLWWIKYTIHIVSYVFRRLIYLPSLWFYNQVWQKRTEPHPV